MQDELDRWQAYLDDELSEKERQRVAETLARDDELRAAFDAFAQAHEQQQARFAPLRDPEHPEFVSFDVDAQFARLQPSLTASTKGTSPLADWFQWQQLSWMGAAMAGVAALLFFVIPTTPIVSTPDAGPSLSTKGWRIKGLSIQMLHQHKGKPQSQRTTSGTRLYPGDFVQFSYLTPKPLHVMVVSIDEKGKISRYIPLDTPNSQKLAAKSGTLPPKEAIEIDDSLGQEMFFILTSTSPFSYANVKQHLQQAHQRNGARLRGLTLKGKDWQVLTSLQINKVRRPKPRQAPR